MSTIQLYNASDSALTKGDSPKAKDLLPRLVAKLEVSGPLGWNKLPRTGDAEVDALIEQANRYLTGE